MDFVTLKLAVGAIATLALFSILFKENPFYRLFEHIYLGLAVGFSVVALWTENLQSQWWERMLGKAAEGTEPQIWAMPMFAFLLPLACLGFMVFSKKYGWMSRIPIGVILGMWGGQQFEQFQTEFVPQIQNSMVSVVPTTWSSMRVPIGIVVPEGTAGEIATAVGTTPELVQRVASNVRLTPPQTVALATETGLTPDQIAQITGDVREQIAGEVFPSQAINNLIFIITLLSVLSYFLFSFELKGKFILGFTRLGRLLLMVGFGAIFGSTVMTRFALLIDRMSFIFVEFLRTAVFRM